jgi:hypothetical protein
MKKQLVLFVAAIGIAVGASNAHAQHGHLNAGAQSTSQDTALIWANGSDFITSSGYVKTLTHTNDGRFAGYYEGNITLTALPATPAHAGPDPAASALGSYLQFSLACLEGPQGGAFGFWDAGSASPSISLSPGQTSTNLWRLTESDGSPDSDPYGHIHGRRFTATRPGIYKVGFIAVDTSTNGTGGGPIHTPSEELSVWFQAGINVASLSRTGNVNTVTFGTLANRNFTLEYSTNLAVTNEWTSISGPIPGDDHLQSLEDADAFVGHRFYRVLMSTP